MRIRRTRWRSRSGISGSGMATSVKVAPGSNVASRSGASGTALARRGLLRRRQPGAPSGRLRDSQAAGHGVPSTWPSSIDDDVGKRGLQVAQPRRGSRGNHAGALAYAEEGLARARSANDTYQIAWMSVRLGVTRYLTGDLERAEQLHNQAMVLFRERGDLRLFALAEGCLADALAKHGELSRALTLRKDALVLLRPFGISWGLVDLILCLAAEIAATTGQAEPAARMFGWADALGG